MIFKIQPELHIEGDARPTAKVSRIRHVAFLDANDASWRGRLELEARGGILHGREETATYLPSVCSCAAAKEYVGRLVVAVTDTSVLLIDYSTRHVREVSSLDARTVTTLHVVPRSPWSRPQLLLAVAGTDGIVRIIDVETHRTMRELSCGKKKAPTLNHLVVFHLRGPEQAGGSRVGVIAAAADGNIYTWHLQHSELPVSCVAAGSEVTGMSLSVSEAEQRLVTIHSDKTLAIWATSPLKEILRVKPRTRVRSCAHARVCMHTCKYLPVHPTTPNCLIHSCSNPPLRAFASHRQTKGSALAYQALAAVNRGHPHGVVWVASTPKDCCLHLIHCHPAVAGGGVEGHIVPLGRAGAGVCVCMRVCVCTGEREASYSCVT